MAQKQQQQNQDAQQGIDQSTQNQTTQNRPPGLSDAEWLEQQNQMNRAGQSQSGTGTSHGTGGQQQNR